MSNGVGVSTCSNFCELRSLITCFCTGGCGHCKWAWPYSTGIYSTGEDECRVCCKNGTNNETCTPFQDTPTLLPAGRFCEGGTCDGNVWTMGTCDLYLAAFFKKTKQAMMLIFAVQPHDI